MSQYEICRGRGYLIDSPFCFIRKHPVHGRDDLYRHVDEPFREYQTNMGAGGWCKSILKDSAEGGARVCLGKDIFNEGFNGRVILVGQCQ